MYDGRVQAVAGPTGDGGSSYFTRSFGRHKVIIVSPEPTTRSLSKCVIPKVHYSRVVFTLTSTQ